MSVLTILHASRCNLISRQYFAKAFANSVFPTPVGPTNIKTPIGLFLFLLQPLKDLPHSVRPVKITDDAKAGYYQLPVNNLLILVMLRNYGLTKWTK